MGESEREINWIEGLDIWDLSEADNGDIGCGL